MKIIEKYKEIGAKFNSIPVDKYIWLVPLIEVLLLLPQLMTYISTEVILVLGFVKIFPSLSGFGFYILKLAVLSDSLILKALSLAPFILKLVFLILSINGKKKFVWLTAGLYVLDFLFSLLFLITGNYDVSILRSDQLIGLLLDLVALVTIQILLAYMFVFYKMYIKGKLKAQPKEVRKKLFSRIALIAVAFIAITTAVFLGVWVRDSKPTATKDEVLLLNQCYDYSQKYLYGELPKDKEALEKIISDIDSVIETDVFKRAFNQSKYKNRLHEVEDDSNYSPLIIKSEFANELMFLKCKILLELNKNEEYLDYYKEIYKYFGSSWTDRYFEYVNKNIDNMTDEQKQLIKTGYREVLASDATDFEKYGVFIGLLWFYQLENEELDKKELEENGILDELNTIYEASFENDEYIKNEELFNDGFKWTSVKDKLYMVN